MYNFKENNYLNEFGLRVRTRREELGLSQEELAIKIGYKSRAAINKLESGIRNINQSKMDALAKALETTPSFLMGWVENPEKKNPISKKNLEDFGISTERLGKLSENELLIVKQLIEALGKKQ